MALGRRKCQQQLMWVATTELPSSPGHVFYEKLNSLLKDAGFDEFVEKLCEPHYARGVGRPGIPPGVYFRMILVGYFDGIDSQREIAWRCADSLSLRQFLGIPLTEKTPDHSSMTKIRQRLPEEVFAEVFSFALGMAELHKLLKGKTLGVDSSILEANAAMKSIVRRETGEAWKEYLARLYAEENGEQPPTEEELRRFDQQRKDKKVPNAEWKSSSDEDARIARMKDGRTHLAYKTEHAVDLETEVIVAAEVYRADEDDRQTIEQTVAAAEDNLIRAEVETAPQEVVGDKGYYKTETLASLEYDQGYRTYIAEPQYRGRRNWKRRSPEEQAAVYANRRRQRGQRGKRLQRLHSERVERSFAHVCDTGGARRCWLRGLSEVRKRYLMAAAYNLGVIMRKAFGFAKPRSGRGLSAFLCFARFASVTARWAAGWLSRLYWALKALPAALRPLRPTSLSTPCPHHPIRQLPVFSTGW